MTNKAVAFNMPDSSHINFQRGSNKSLKKFNNLVNGDCNEATDSTDYFEETFDTFETVVVQSIAPLTDEHKKTLDSDSKSSFNDFEYWNRSISNIDSLLMVDPMHNEDSEGTDDDDENIYANEIIEFEYQETAKPEKEPRKSSFNNIESTSSTTSADELVNAYYARKLGTTTAAPLNNLELTNKDPQSLSTTKINETTYLKWDYDKNTFVESTIESKNTALSIDVNPKGNEQPPEPLSPTGNLITSQRFLHTSSHSLANSNFTSPVQSPETASANQLLSSSSVVSKIKSWLIRPTKAPPSQNTTPISTQNDEIKTVRVFSFYLFPTIRNPLKSF